MAVDALTKLARRRHSVDVEQADDTVGLANLGKDIIELKRLFIDIGKLERLLFGADDMNRAKVKHRDREIGLTAPEAR